MKKVYMTPATGIDEMSVTQVLCASVQGPLGVPFATGDPEADWTAD